MYEVYIGCDEWQQSTQFDTLEAAIQYVDGFNGDFTMGLYSATDVWIENIVTGEKNIIIDEHEGDCDLSC